MQRSDALYAEILLGHRGLGVHRSVGYLSAIIRTLSAIMSTLSAIMRTECNYGYLSAIFEQ